MNTLIFLLLTFVVKFGASSPSPAFIQDEMQNPVNVLMKDLTKYHVVIFWKGPNWSAGSQAIIEGRSKESQQLKDLVKSGKLVGVVRVSIEADCKILGFFKTDSKEEAWAIVDSLPAVKEQLLTPEIYQIWGTRGMGKEIHEQLKEGKKPEKRQSLFFTLFKKGTNWKADVPEDSSKAWASRHAAAVLKWKESGSLNFYGAVDDTGPLRVMGIFSAKGLDEAKKRLGEAPAVKGGWFTADTYPCSVLEGILP
jgi:muconolactone delta-isomerase